MNRSIARIFGLFTLLFAVLIGFTSEWSVFEADALEDNTANRRPLLEASQVPRGEILAADGTKLAVPEQIEGGESPRFTRRYPEGSLFSHSVGYFFIDSGASGLERFYNDELTGEGDELESLFGDFSGEEEGDDLATNLDPAGQRAAIEALGGQAGSVVAIEPDTGKVRVMASLPTYDPNAIPEQLDELNRADGSPILNRATQARYQPGSTFKVITAAAALDSGEFSPETLVDGSSPAEIGGVPLENFEGEAGGTVPLSEALTRSVNTAFARIGEQLGTDTMFEYMDRFAFFSEPPIDYPADQLLPSGVFEGERLVRAGDPVDIGRVAIGQERLQVTPLQMAMVVQAIANDGVLMAPRLGDAVMGDDGRVLDRIGSSELSRVTSGESADALTDMMVNVVAAGTGTNAQISGVDVAGKTGTAEIQGGLSNQASFVAFAPADEPEVAIAVTVEETQATGGDVAAPIAKQVMEVLLSDE
ncbi:MAG TPA: penicillin-binding protein 2 [Thermoleophilaceae bacterium]|nr:penicillin-binding protein 2 [Thermoleophilaceae bacterium]